MVIGRVFLTYFPFLLIFVMNSIWNVVSGSWFVLLIFCFTIPVIVQTKRETRVRRIAKKTKSRVTPHWHIVLLISFNISCRWSLWVVLSVNVKDCWTSSTWRPAKLNRCNEICRPRNPRYEIMLILINSRDRQHSISAAPHEEDPQKNTGPDPGPGPPLN